MSSPIRVESGDWQQSSWSEADVLSQASTLLGELKSRGWKLGCAESLTGGMLVSTFVGVPGASQVLLGGVVAYTNAMKTRVLGVDADMLETHTAYSEECAMSLAEGANQLFGAQVSLASTGVAGPGSDLGFNPGFGFLGCITPEKRLVCPVELEGTLSRQRIRQVFVLGALALLRTALLRV